MDTILFILIFIPSIVLHCMYPFMYRLGGLGLSQMYSLSEDMWSVRYFILGTAILYHIYFCTNIPSERGKTKQKEKRSGATHRGFKPESM
jgi:hypothetical protein